MHGDIRATEGLALKRHMHAARSISIMRTSPCFPLPTLLATTDPSFVPIENHVKKVLPPSPPRR